MPGLWRNQDGTRAGKYLVLRRDNTVLDCPYFVLGARDPAAPMALLSYADDCERRGFDAEYVADMRALAGEFAQFYANHGPGDPDAPRHRKDDPAVVSRMLPGRSA